MEATLLRDLNHSIHLKAQDKMQNQPASFTPSSDCHVHVQQGEGELNVGSVKMIFFTYVASLCLGGTPAKKEDMP